MVTLFFFHTFEFKEFKIFHSVHLLFSKLVNNNDKNVLFHDVVCKHLKTYHNF